MSETDADGRESPTRILPAESVLDIDDYLAMQRVLGDETCFRTLYALKRVDDADAADLAVVLDEETDRIESSLDDLADVGLVRRWTRKTPEMDEDEFSDYYQVSSLGVGLLEEGIEDLLRSEWDVRDRYA